MNINKRMNINMNMNMNPMDRIKDVYHVIFFFGYLKFNQL